MKFYAILLLTLAIPYAATSQTQSRTNKKNITPATFQNVPPEEAFPRWFAARLDDSNSGDSTHPAAINEPFIVSLSVDELGYLSDVDNIASIDSVLFGRIESIIMDSPKWTPAHKRKKPIVTEYVLFRKHQASEFTLKLWDDADFVMPKFEGGDLRTFRRWFESQLVYPQSASSRNREGTVIMEFNVDRQGYNPSSLNYKKIVPINNFC
jgi:hypothetical protein